MGNQHHIFEKEMDILPLRFVGDIIIYIINCDQHTYIIYKLRLPISWPSLSSYIIIYNIPNWEGGDSSSKATYKLASSSS